jgi:hypothetical protein
MEAVSHDRFVEAYVAAWSVKRSQLGLLTHKELLKEALGKWSCLERNVVLRVGRALLSSAPLTAEEEETALWLRTANEETRCVR